MRALADKAPKIEDPALSLADRAYVALRDWLISLEIAPGTAINEERIAADLGMGRTPVREAVRRLVLEDLVHVYPRRGTFAADINITDLAAISEVRLPLEGHAAALAAERLTTEQARDLDRLLKEAGRSARRPPSELMELDGRIHRSVYSWTANRYLEQTLTRYLNLSMRIWHLVLVRLPGLLDRVQEHAVLLEAIRERDAASAERIARDHVIAFEREIRSVL